MDFTNLFVLLKDGNPAGPYASLAQAKAAGAVSLNVGVFINAIINFLIVAFAIFMVIKNVNRLKKEEAVAPPPPASTRNCPFCYSTIAIKATRCPHCTSEIKG